jgi:hypothetical protein
VAVLRTGARRLLEQAIEAEVEIFLASMREPKLEIGISFFPSMPAPTRIEFVAPRFDRQFGHRSVCQLI